MIINNLENTVYYESIHPLFKQAFDYLKTTNFQQTELGVHYIDDDNLFSIVSDSKLHAPTDVKLERHNRYIDIQMPITKMETFGWKSQGSLMSPKGLFDAELDIQFFEDEAASYFSLSPTNFVVFFPQDAHAPCIGEGVVRKVVVKIKYEYPR